MRTVPVSAVPIRRLRSLPHLALDNLQGGNQVIKSATALKSQSATAVAIAFQMSCKVSWLYSLLLGWGLGGEEGSANTFTAGLRLCSLLLIFEAGRLKVLRH